MKVTVLGSGTSHGVPVIGCTCAVCTSPDPKNKRTRPSILVTSKTGTNILIDTPPDMRQQFLDNHVSRLDAILYTHSHADHIFGLDDVRTFNYRQKHKMPLYAEPAVEADIRRIYSYIFRDGPVGGGKPEVTLNTIEPGVGLTLGGGDILPLRVYHGRLPILAFKFGPSFAYVTDVSRIPEATWPHLKNLDLLILDAVRREPHETHFHLDAALGVIAQLKPKRALLTHLSHDYDHETVNRELPDAVELAYDGQVVELDDRQTPLPAYNCIWLFQQHRENCNEPSIDRNTDIEQLSARLLDDDHDTRYNAAIAITRMGRPVFATVLAWTNDPLPRRREMACYILGQIQEDRVSNLRIQDGIPVLLRLLETDPDEAVRSGAASALGHQADVTAIPALIEAALDQSEEVRFGATHALGCYDDDDPYPHKDELRSTLLRLMDDPVDRIRDWATFGIHTGGHDTPEIRARLWRALDDPYQDVVDEAAVALGKFQDRTFIPRLEQMLLSDESLSPCYFEAAEHLADPVLLPAVRVAAQRWQDVLDDEEMHPYVTSALEALERLDRDGPLDQLG